MKILIASQNVGKQREFRKWLPESVSLVFPQDIPNSKDFDVEETGETYIENSRLKAVSFYTQTGIASLADDSGLEVTALDNMPGLHSKRFFPGTDEDRNVEILKRLQNSDDRSARFVCVISLALSQENVLSFTGVAEGTIAHEITGTEGFGYDSIFIPTNHTLTYSELGVEYKSTISHRAEALKLVRDYLSTNSN